MEKAIGIRGYVAIKRTDGSYNIKKNRFGVEHTVAIYNPLDKEFESSHSGSKVGIGDSIKDFFRENLIE
jgi:hypothetical protein